MSGEFPEYQGWMILYLLGSPTFRNDYSPNSICLPSLIGADLALDLWLLSPCTLHWLQYQAPPVGPSFLPQVPLRWNLWSELELWFHGVHYSGGGCLLGSGCPYAFCGHDSSGSYFLASKTPGWSLTQSLFLCDHFATDHFFGILRKIGI